MRRPEEVAARHRGDALAILRAAIAAVEPGELVGRALSLQGTGLVAGDHRLPLAHDSRIVVVGAGKATPAMAAAAEAVLGPRLTAGSINTKHGHRLSLATIRTVECGHPLPDDAGVEGTRRMLRLVDGLGPDDVVLCLFSGGGSALMPAPANGIRLEEKVAVTDALLRCGATIDELNAVRKHLSEVKGGQLARRAAPARVVSLMISDVIGDPVHTIASGPTCADPTTFEDCLRLVDRYRLRPALPASVVARFERGAAGHLPETPGAEDPSVQAALNLVIGNNSLALDAAREEAVHRGYRTLVLSTRIAGETREAAGFHAAIAAEIVLSGQPVPYPACLISGGETTVTLRGGGKGGRNQEFALAAALGLEGTTGITVMSAGTDGTDGPTDAAGAIADGTTLARAAAAGLSAGDHLERNDSYPFFEALGDLIVTGPTGTNVMDLRLMLVG